MLIHGDEGYAMEAAAAARAVLANDINKLDSGSG
jgi:hypothetical protein